MHPGIETRRQHRILEKEYGSFYRAVSDILFQHNPMDLDGKRNTGEYDPEVNALLSRLDEAQDVHGLHGLLFDVFRTDFGDEHCGDKESYAAATFEIWKAYQRQRAM